MSENSLQSDARWQDEYAKRRFVCNVWAAISTAYLWGTIAAAGRMAIKKAGGEKIDFHARKTPLMLAGIFLVGAGISAITQDQVTHQARLEKQRLARRMESSDTANIGSFAEDKVKWREILKPSWLGGKISGENPEFERRWYNAYFRSRAIRSYFAATAAGTFVTALTYSIKKMVDAAAGQKPEYHPIRMPAAVAAMMGIGTVALYKSTLEESRQILFEDNYLAHLVKSRKKNATLTPADEALAINTGEPIPENAEANRVARSNKKWLKSYHREYSRHTFFDQIGQATFLSMFAVFGNMAIDKAAEKETHFHKIYSSLLFVGLMGVGAIFEYVSCSKESKCLKIKDDRLAQYLHKDADEEQLMEKPSSQPATPPEKSDSRYWQNKITSPAYKAASFSLAM